MIIWPSCLPQYLNMDSYGEAAGDMQLRSGMDAGPDKVRRRFTAAVRPLQGEIIVTQEQFAFFKTWYNDTLLGGTLRFGWIEPWSDTIPTNLLSNPGFESNTASWSESGIGGTFAVVDDGMFGNCLEMNQNTTVSYVTAEQLGISITIGNTYSLSGYTKLGTKTTDTPRIGLDNGGWLTSDDSTTALDDWAFIDCDYLATVSTVNCFLQSATLEEGTLLFDEIALVDISNITEMRFKEPPTYSAAGGAYIKISMSLEILP